MALGLVAEKIGMTRVFGPKGEHIPVTIVQVTSNKVTQLKTIEGEGYTAVQVARGLQKPSRLTQAEAGHYRKANVEPARGLTEFRVTPKQLAELQVGQDLTVDLFKSGDFVDVMGYTKGRGFSGSVRRHNFGTQPNSHGCSLTHRAVGSTGQRQDPGRVFPGKKMPGQYGNERVTILNLKVVKSDPARQVLYIQGAVPGAPGAILVIRPTNRNAVAVEQEGGV